jgi:hypothetical protein
VTIERDSPNLLHKLYSLGLHYIVMIILRFKCQLTYHNCETARIHGIAYLFQLLRVVSFRFVVLPSSTYLLTAGVEVIYLHLITLRHTPQSVGLLRTRDRPVAETSTWQHTNTHKRQTSMPPLGFEPTIPASAQPQTYALDRAATGIGLTDGNLLYYCYVP